MKNCSASYFENTKLPRQHLVSSASIICIIHLSPSPLSPWTEQVPPTQSVSPGRDLLGCAGQCGVLDCATFFKSEEDLARHVKYGKMFKCSYVSQVCPSIDHCPHIDTAVDPGPNIAVPLEGWGGWGGYC